MRKALCLMLLLLFLPYHVTAADPCDILDSSRVTDALPQTAKDLLEGQTAENPGDLTEGIQGILVKTIGQSQGPFRAALAQCLQILAVVLLAAVFREFGESGNRALLLAAVLSIGAICVGNISGLFSTAARTVDDMAAFSSFLLGGMATATAATGAVGTASTLYGGTMLLCGALTRVAEQLVLPGVAGYLALLLGDYALGDSALRMLGDALKQLLTQGMKAAVILVTTYLSLTGVISGTADAAAIKAAKLAISSTIPVVGSMLADASETILVSAGLVRSSLGVFGLLGLLAVSAGPVLQTGMQYLLLKGTSAAAGLLGEKELSGLIGSMAGAMGILTGLTSVCALLLMVACVSFMRVSV